MKRDIRDELPPVLRAWWTWTERGLSGLSHVPALVGWLLHAVFLPVAVACLITVALAVLWLAAGVGHVCVSLAALVKPAADVVTFQRRAAR